MYAETMNGGNASVDAPGGALAARVDGALVDLSRAGDGDADVVRPGDREALPLLRHSAAHLLAAAVRSLTPRAKIGFGPAIDNGFYYDFQVERPFTPDDLRAIEAAMRELAARDDAFERRVVSKDEARALFADDPLKLERLEEMGEGEVISIYRNGAFVDLCRGPHVPSTGKLKVFKLMKVAGAYWRGDSKNEMLQRIYGTAWAKKEDQEPTCTMLEEAEKRDHRKLGAQLDLFHMQDEAPGMVFWHPKGWALWQQVEQYMRRVYRDNGYQEVAARRSSTLAVGEVGPLGELPRQHVHDGVGEARLRAQADELPRPRPDLQLGLRSYRDLPLRYGEFGAVPPQRAVGRAARHHARARLHAGRRPHLLHSASSGDSWSTSRARSRCGWRRCRRPCSPSPTRMRMPRARCSASSAPPASAPSSTPAVRRSPIASVRRRR
jgi:threonyl-tRNA synthetase